MAEPVRWTKEQVLAWESRWSLPAGLLTLLAVAVLIASAVVIGKVSGSGEAELLRSAHQHAGSLTLSSILEALGFVMLVAPLYLLFRATAARSEQVRYQLIGLIVAAPLFFAVSAVLNATATREAADSFVAGEAKSTLSAKEAGEECRSERRDEGAKKFGEEHEGGPNPLAACGATKVADEEASNALSEAGTRAAATGFALGGRLGLAVALLYTCLWAMRVGLLSRFWGSLGMALGVAALLLLVQFVLIFFIYLGLLLIGRIPGGRPPAWAAAAAVPWPTPGEQAAAELEGPGGASPGGGEPEGPAGEASAGGAAKPEGPAGEASAPGGAAEPEGPATNGSGSGPGPERRKRKQRD